MNTSPPLPLVLSSLSLIAISFQFPLVGCMPLLQSLVPRACKLHAPTLVFYRESSWLPGFGGNLVRCSLFDIADITSRPDIYNIVWNKQTKRKEKTTHLLYLRKVNWGRKRESGAPAEPRFIKKTKETTTYGMIATWIYNTTP